MESEKQKDLTVIYNFPYIFTKKEKMDKNIIEIINKIWKKLKKKKEMIEKTYYNSSNESEAD